MDFISRLPIVSHFKDTELKGYGRILLLFAISGFSALIYQTVWQRALFQYFGVNIESITVIVSIFMFGLGVGSLVGGRLSKIYPEKCLKLFIICEILVGIFGIFSLKIINGVAQARVSQGLLSDALVIYSLLALPTIMVGATLPLLVSYMYRVYHQVGKTVSLLYFINTLGSALACFFTVHVLFLWTGMQFSVLFAAVCNAIVAYLTYTILKEKGELKADVVCENDKARVDTRTILMWALSASSAFIFMSQEILWFRLYSQAPAGRAVMFPYTLGIILLGIAFGSFYTEKIISKIEDKILGIIGLILLSTAIANYIINPIAAKLMFHLTVKYRLLGLGLLLTSTFIISFFNGFIFPLLNHYAIKSKEAVGSSVSGIYFSNIVGSTIGPLVTGFILLEHFGLEENFLIFAILSSALGLLLLLLNLNKAPVRPAVIWSIVGVSVLSYALHKKIYFRFFENMMNVTDMYKYSHQDRHGILNVIADPDGDVMIGGGIYDGRFNTSLAKNHNGIERAYIMSAFHPNPERVLMIGLATGSWAKIISTYEKVKTFDIVEISPGYLELIKNYPEIQSMFANPKVNVIIDDGRRWLKNNPDKKYDYIVMNTSYYYRGQANNILSVEFLKLVKAHLKEGGIVYYNSTTSHDVPYTTAHVFNYVTNFGNHIAGSDSHVGLPEEDRVANLKLFTENGKIIHDESLPVVQAILNKIIKADLSNKRQLLLDNPNYAQLITDDSLTSEYKTNKPFSWGWIMRKLNKYPDDKIITLNFN